jgi:hypothetical protein
VIDTDNVNAQVNISPSVSNGIHSKQTSGHLGQTAKMPAAKSTSWDKGPKKNQYYITLF